MLCLKYQPGHNDGFGAQYQRILGIYCICKAFNIHYIHTPFSDIEYQGLQSLTDNCNSSEYVNECNRRIQLKNNIDITSIPDIKEVKLNTIDINTLLTFQNKCKTENVNIIISLKIPYAITDRIPDIYKHANNIYQHILPKNSTFTIGIHVRRGELYVVDSDRMLPNSFYIQTAQKIIKECEKHNIDYIIELYTEVPEKDIIVTNEHVGVNGRIPKTTTISKDSDKIQEFDILPNLNKYINEKMLDTFDRMINCDVLIGSRSSMTACASYIKNGITVYHKFWHNMISSDIEVSDSLFENKLTNFIVSSSNTNNINAIPKHIYQVWMQGNGNEHIKNNVMLFNAGYQYSFFNEKSCYKYIQDHFDKNIADVFTNLNNPAHKCDLFRYCLLYREGGIYIDYDLQMNVSLDTMIQQSNYSEFITSIGAHSNNRFGECTNGFIFTNKENPIFLQLINHIVNTPNPSDYGNYVKDLYNKLNNPNPFQSFIINNVKTYLFKEVCSEQKYYIINEQNRAIVNTNGHNYLQHMGTI
jgi:hypothetical protein